MTRAAAVLAMAVGLWSCADGPPVPRTGRAEAAADTVRTVPLKGRLLVLDGFAGTVTLRSNAVATAATVRFTRRARGATRASAAARLEAIQINEASDESIYQLVWRTTLSEGASVDAEVTLPLSAGAVVRLDRGDLAAHNLRGPLDAAVSVGEIRLDSLRSSTVRASIGRGRVATTAAAVPPGARWHLRVGRGDAAVRLPAEASAVVVAATGAGTVTVRGLPLSRVERQRTGEGSRLRGQLGDGEATVRVETGAGRVLLGASR